MINKICNTCLFKDICHIRRGCDNYTPAGDDAEDAQIDTYIEERRIEFADEWRIYTSDDYE